MSHKSKQYLTNPKPRLLYQSWGSNAFTSCLQQFSCPLASHSVTVAKEMETHVPWGAKEQAAIGQIIPHLKKHTYTHWEEDIKGNKIGCEVKDHPKKEKKGGKC